MAQTDEVMNSYEVREVIARFEDASKFEDVVEVLEENGIDRAKISIIASHDAVKKKLGHLYHNARELEENGSVPQAIYSDRHDIAEGKAAIIGLPVYIGGAGAGLAVVASGGTLAFAALIAAAGATAGAGIGALFATALGKHHANYLAEQLSLGSLLLWVQVDGDTEEKKVLELLEQGDGVDVHAHSLTRYWGDEDVPLHSFNPDPFLEADPVP